MTAGIEDVLSDDLLERRILVTNGAGAYATAIAEYAFAAMVMLCRRIPELAVAHERHRWLESHPLGSELAGKRVGIVGYGGIGRALARLCAGAGMTVWGLRRKHAEEDEEEMMRMLTTTHPFLTLVATLGERGCAVTGEGVMTLVEGVDVASLGKKVVNTTGCGDAFSAGFLRGLSLGRDHSEAATLGCAAAALVAQGLGTDHGDYDLARVDGFASEASRRAPA